MTNLETHYYRDSATDTRYRVCIIADPDATSPRDATNVTVMHTFDRNYYSPEDITYRHDRPTIFPREYDSRHRAGDWAIDMRRAKKYAALDPDILAVRGLDRGHDGTLILSDDDETAGYIAVTRESWAQCMGDSPLEGGPWLLTKTGEPDPENAEGNRTPSVEEVMRQDVEAYNRWARGEYVGVIVEQELLYALDPGQGPWDGHAIEPPESITVWQEVEACWGYDDQEYALSEALSWLPEDVEEEQWDSFTWRRSTSVTGTVPSWMASDT